MCRESKASFHDLQPVCRAKLLMMGVIVWVAQWLTGPEIVPKEKVTRSVTGTTVRGRAIKWCEYDVVKPVSPRSTESPMFSLLTLHKTLGNYRSTWNIILRLSKSWFWSRLSLSISYMCKQKNQINKSINCSALPSKLSFKSFMDVLTAVCYEAL